ncbi:hypothetical protein ACJDU8_04635 [Clostridium sp. WILCCON 0269]|uniref:DUF3784 domain-containing protein n=1 Tax=Candidatus Clostridium eludens TaxID=3381663 RepID=A0ABW8SFP4_9CLOT
MDSTMTNLLTFLGFMGIIQGLGMKYSKTVREKFRLDAEGVDKKYINFKANFLIILGAVILITQFIAYYYSPMSGNLEIMLSSFLLLAITVDFMYKRSRRKKNQQKAKK